MKHKIRVIAETEKIMKKLTGALSAVVSRLMNVTGKDAGGAAAVRADGYDY